jgi:hypothetical protein
VPRRSWPASGSVTSYADTTPANGTRYFYRADAVKSVGAGGQSNEVAATPRPPGPPTAAVLDAFDRSAGSLGTNWR